jgi:hypothetical protein
MSIEDQSASLAGLGYIILRRFSDLGSVAPTKHQGEIRDSLANGFDAVDLESEEQRFRLWAVNLGLYHQGHSALDYWLRDNLLIREFTAELLGSLDTTLRERKLHARYKSYALTPIQFLRL